MRRALSKTCMFLAVHRTTARELRASFVLTPRGRCMSSLSPAQRRSMAFNDRCTLPAFSSSRLLSSATTFQPADPPVTHGTPVFSDIDFTVAEKESSESRRRNTDPDAVYVVTGASRGIGLQFVKTLLERTKVRLQLKLSSYSVV